MKNLVAILGVSFFGAATINRYKPIGGFFADVTTNTAERNGLNLVDGSMLKLNARTAVNIDGAKNGRSIELLEGQIHVRTKLADIPLNVRVRDMVVSTYDADFTVSYASGFIRIAVVSNALRVKLRGELDETLSSGQGLLISEYGVEHKKIDKRAELAWEDGVVELNNEPLGYLVAQLRNYRAGVIRIEPEVASMRVSGLFGLDDSDASLDALPKILPVKVSRATDFWVTIERLS